ncbi:MAG: hypothetical protein HS117_21775 [Verrucomicrobiaceae bacterium]|nr:hypothetical protein [Verrucomicrobiaceae bacterium]
MQGELADLASREVFSRASNCWARIARMTAQGLGALGDEVLLPLLDLGESQRVLASSLRGGGLASGGCR